MAYEKKLPSIRATLTKEDYNKLIELITDVKGINIEDIKKKSDEIKRKLLIYSEIKDEKVLLRFFPSQIEYVLYILLFNSKNVMVSNNYYDILVANKEKYKQEMKTKEEGGEVCWIK